MKYNLDIQIVTLDFWLNRLLIEKYGTRILGKVVNNKIYLFWWKGTCVKGCWIKVGEGKLNFEINMPSKSQIDKNIQKAVASK